jgi:hypothetical protein
MKLDYHKERAHALRLKSLYFHSVARYVLLDEEKSHEERQALSNWNTAQAIELMELADLEETLAQEKAA